MAIRFIDAAKFLSDKEVITVPQLQVIFEYNYYAARGLMANLEEKGLYKYAGGLEYKMVEGALDKYLKEEESEEEIFRQHIVKLRESIQKHSTYDEEEDDRLKKKGLTREERKIVSTYACMGLDAREVIDALGLAYQYDMMGKRFGAMAIQMHMGVDFAKAARLHDALMSSGKVMMDPNKPTYTKVCVTEEELDKLKKLKSKL